MGINDLHAFGKTVTRWSAAALLGVALCLLNLASPAIACGPSAPMTSAELLSFQIGIIERGIAREALTAEQRAEIAKLRADVEMFQKAEKREEAREAMKKIVAMFKHKDMMGAVEPIVPGCAAPRANVVTGTLVAIAIEPNVAGARCGNHYVLSVKEIGGGGKISKLAVYDLAKAPYDTLKAMLNKPVEVDTLGSGVIGMRLAGTQPTKVADLSGLSPRKPC